MKHSDVQRGIEPVYQSAWSTDPACGRWENAAAESKQISGWFDPAGFLLAPGSSSRRIRLSLSAESCVYFSLPTHPTPSWGLVLQWASAGGVYGWLCRGRMGHPKGVGSGFSCMIGCLPCLYLATSAHIKI
jgi:hypothetical protein